MKQTLPNRNVRLVGANALTGRAFSFARTGCLAASRSGTFRRAAMIPPSAPAVAAVRIAGTAASVLYLGWFVYEFTRQFLVVFGA